MLSNNNSNQNHKIILQKAIELLKIKSGIIDPIADYLDILLKKNEELNLISRKLDINTIIQDHIFDCLAAWQYFKDYSSITDIGTGGGLPGILLAIIFPDKKILLIEKSHKKFIFLNDVVKQLDLINVKIYNSLVSEHKIQTESVTCRAFKSIIEILSMTMDFYKNNGTYILYKGRNDKIIEEINDAKKKYQFDYSIHKIEEIKEKERHIIIIKKIIFLKI